MRPGSSHVIFRTQGTNEPVSKRRVHGGAELRRDTLLSAVSLRLCELCVSNPEVTVQRSVADGFGEVGFVDGFVASDVGDSAGDSEDLVMGAG